MTVISSKSATIRSAIFQQSIYISGFMGTGKSTVGLELARRLALPFLDTDRAISAKVGRSIRWIFSKKGEAFFRAQEIDLLLSLTHQRPQVISLGGGMVADPRNREIFRRGLWVNLNCLPSVLEKRLQGNKTRPLLGDKKSSIHSLLNQRRPTYNLAPNQMDTTGKSVDAIAEKIIYLLKRAKR